MELKVQKYLRYYKGQGTPLEGLNNDYAINVTFDESGSPLVILNYDQIDSPKNSPITRECRGLVLDTSNNYEVVAKSFNRFYNYGENREELNKFNWKDFSCQDKEDGSLLIVYNYKGTWRVNTRASFGKGEIGFKGSGRTWENAFFEDIYVDNLDNVSPHVTLVFELCSLHNKIVRHYPQQYLFLLTMFNRDSGYEYQSDIVDDIAKLIKCLRPKSYSFKNIDEILEFLEEKSRSDATFEGFVIKDSEGIRIKVKSKAYLRLHKMRGNGDQLISPKNLVPFIMTGETGELLAIFPEVAPYVDQYKAKLDDLYKRVITIWESAKDIKGQTKFAEAVLTEKDLSFILFEARKRGVHPKIVWSEATDTLLKRFF